MFARFIIRGSWNVLRFWDAFLNDFERGTKYYLFVLINRWRIVRKTGRSEYFVDGI